MSLENECVNKRSERIFELAFSLVTGTVGGFIAFIFIWLLNGTIINHTMDGFAVVFLSILFLIAYWFLKLTYKLAFNKATYLLSTAELMITGWFFFLFPFVATVLYLINGQIEDLFMYLAPTLPGCFYGYYALKVAKKRKTASNRVAGGFSPPAPTPPGMRVRTGRFDRITGP
jgi:hypothetical protein